MRRFLYTMALALAGVCSLYAAAPADSTATTSQDKPKVKFDYDVCASTQLDNREYDRTSLDESRTIFGVRAQIGLGARVEHGGFTHRILAGADPLYHFGGGWKVEPLVFYEMSMPLKHCTLGIDAGAFPRNRSRAYYGEAFFSDADIFLNRSYKGMQFSWTGERFYYEFGCNWMGQFSKDAPDRREQFFIYSGGAHKVLSFSTFGYSAILHHYACSQKASNVVDDALVRLYYENDMGSAFGIQSFKNRLSYLQAYQCDRAASTKAQLPMRGEWYMEMRNWNVALINTLSFGKDLMPLYDLTDPAGNIYASDLYMGDPLMRNNPGEKCGLYDKIGIFYEPRICEGLHLRVQVNFMFNLSGYIGTQQLLGVAYALPYFL